MTLPEGWDDKNGSKDVLVLLKKDLYDPIWTTGFYWNKTWNIRSDPASIKTILCYPEWKVIKWQELPSIDL